MTIHREFTGASFEECTHEKHTKSSTAHQRMAAEQQVHVFVFGEQFVFAAK